MAHGLPRKIKLAFIGQALVATLVISLGLLLGGLIVRQMHLHSLLQEQARALRAELARNPAAPLPSSIELTAHRVPRGAHVPGVPDHVRGASPGLHPFADDGTVIYVDQGPEDTLYLVYRPDLLNRAVFYTAAVALVLSLLVMYLSWWLTYRTSKRLVAPVAWLANEVKNWDPRQPDSEVLAPGRLPPEAGTEVEALAQSLRGLAGRIGDFVNRERDFTRDASHELRTPLTVIRVATDLLLGEPDLSVRQQRSLGRVQRAARDMEGVIEAFLILAREAEVAPQSERLRVREIVDEEVQRARPLLQGKPVELHVTDDGAPSLEAPPHVLNVMLGNLLSNAARYTESGRIDVHLRPDRLEVHDTGIGMTPDVLAKAFDPFFRLDHDRLEGKGIGLSIVRRLGERFHWPVTLDSVPGVGTVATIRFGAAAAD